LEAVSATATDSLETVVKLSALHKQNIEKLPVSNRKTDNLRRIFDYIEQYPIVDIKKTAQDLELSYNTVSTAVKKLVTLGILKETTNTSRNRVFSYEEYLNILRKDT
jgi:predicted transcriptional regulator